MGGITSEFLLVLIKCLKSYLLALGLRAGDSIRVFSMLLKKSFFCVLFQITLVRMSFFNLRQSSVRAVLTTFRFIQVASSYMPLGFNRSRFLHMAVWWKHTKVCHWDG